MKKKTMLVYKAKNSTFDDKINFKKGLHFLETMQVSDIEQVIV